MKPYIAIYLPIEGEIKDGDLIRNKEGQVFKASWIVKEQTTKKVKLFLCSRDIQVGDNARSVGSPNLDSIINDTDLMLQETYNCFFKVIGEISSKATWVKEGDEFDKEEVRKKSLVKRDIEIKEGIETRTAWGDRVKVIKLSNNPIFWGHTCEYLDESELNHNINCKKGETYEYDSNVLGYIDLYYYEILGPCKHFH